MPQDPTKSHAHCARPTRSALFLFIGTQNGNVSRELDADILQFGSPLYLQFHVYEGTQATATITGRIVGDPVLTAERTSVIV